MQTIIRVGDGTTKTFDVPGSDTKTVYVNGAIVAKAAEDFGSVTLVSPPAKGSYIDIEYGSVPVATPSGGAVTIADNLNTQDPSQALSALQGFILGNRATVLEQSANQAAQRTAALEQRAGALENRTAALEARPVGGGTSTPAVATPTAFSSAIKLDIADPGRTMVPSDGSAVDLNADLTFSLDPATPVPNGYCEVIVAPNGKAINVGPFVSFMGAPFAPNAVGKVLYAFTRKGNVNGYVAVNLVPVAIAPATPAPVFIDQTPFSGPVIKGETISYQFATDRTATFTSSSLPPGITLSSSGLLGGAPTAAASYVIPITATGSGGSTTINVNLTTALGRFDYLQRADSRPPGTPSDGGSGYVQTFHSDLKLQGNQLGIDGYQDGSNGLDMGSPHGTLQLQVGTVAGGGEIGAVFRGNGISGSSRRSYTFSYSDGQWKLAGRTENDTSPISSVAGAAPAQGDIIEVEMRPTDTNNQSAPNVFCRVNGVQLLSFRDVQYYDDWRLHGVYAGANGNGFSTGISRVRFFSAAA